MAKTVLQVAVEQVDDLIAQHMTALRAEIRSVLPDLVKGALGQVFGMEDAPAPAKPASAAAKLLAAPKKRGRPPKALAEARAQAAQAAAAPKKRGRPPKVKVEVKATAAEAPKKRGRPPKVSLESVHSQVMALTQNSGPKKRGRPPGSKNKPKDLEAEPTETISQDLKKLSYQELKAQLEAGKKLAEEAVN
jgi:hypothetical protein